jgi:hypothetical protein
MPSAYPRPPRSATVPKGRSSAIAVGGNGVAALIEAAADAGTVDPRALPDLVGLNDAAFAGAVARGAFTREQQVVLARALHVERAIVRAACEVASRAQPDDDEEPSESVPNVEADTREEVPSSAEADLPDARPGTLGELLSRTIAAVSDDAFGRRLRLSLLATVHTAAAEVGRTVPTECHDLRQRVARGTIPWVGDGGVIVDESDASDERALLDAVTAAIRTVQRMGSGYDDLFAPLHDDALDALLRSATASPRLAALGLTSACAVTPPLFGRYLVLCSADATPDQRRLALRRALAHVLCGHVGEYTPLPFPAPPSASRVADVFALADLIPFWQLHDWRRKGKLGWAGVVEEATRIAIAIAGDWSRVRASDAAKMRVRLYRESGL